MGQIDEIFGPQRKAADERIRFEPLEWLAIAWVTSDADPLAVMNKVRSLCAMHTDQRTAVARIEALITMAAMVRCYGAARFARYLTDFRNAGFTDLHLELLADSMTCATRESHFQAN